MIDDSYPSLLDLPAELILHIIKMLPQSSYYKCLSVSKRLAAIENEHVAERSTMCICRLHEHIPNLPSRELKLLLCIHAQGHQFESFIKIIKRRPLTCNTIITGKENYIQNFRNYLKKYIHHPNVKYFFENSKTNIADPVKYEWCKSIDLCKYEENGLETEFITTFLEITLGQDKNLIKKFSDTLRNSCFRNVSIHCNSINLPFFIRCLEDYCQFFDVVNFQRKTISMRIDHVTSTLIHINLLNAYQNLDQLFFTISELSLENVKFRLLELAQCLQQANLKKLTSFVLYEDSPLIFAKHLIPAWETLFNAIPSNNLELLEIRSKTNDNQLGTQYESSNSLSLANSITRFQHLQFLTVHHLGFDITLIRILPFFRELKKLDLCINMNMSNRKVINELCQNLEKCNNLEDIAIYVPAEWTMLFRNIFASLAKLQQLNKISLHFDLLNIIPAVEGFKKLVLMRNLREVKICIRNNELYQSNSWRWMSEELKKQIVQFVPQQCEVSIC